MKRFQTVAVKCDLNSLQIGVNKLLFYFLLLSFNILTKKNFFKKNKPFLFITIRKDDRELTEFLLQREIDLNTRYTVSRIF